MEFYRFDLLKRYENCIHGVTLKNMNMPYNCSLALHTGEEASLIVQNRQAVTDALGIGVQYQIVLADQTHSDHIHIVTQAETRGWRERESAIASCDALITAQTEVMLGILTADCVPILLFDPHQEVVAAVHAGWKGTKANIVAKTVAHMETHFGCNPQNIIAAIGPSIGQCCYEVGEEVAEHFSCIEGAYQKRENGKYMLNLKHINKYQLLKSGLLSNNIEQSSVCTSCDTERFFSYRKEQGCSGRFMSLIGISPEAEIGRR